MSSVRLNQVSDLHLGTSSGETLGGVRTLESFQAVLDALQEEGRGRDLTLLTGDLAGDAQPAAYQLLNETLKERQCRAAWLPGNHDDPAVMRDGLVDFPAHRCLDLGAWTLLFVDSSQRSSPAGHISHRELEEVAAALAALKNRHLLVAMHHMPIDTGSAWLDQQRIDNQQLLYEILISHGGVRLVITGHVHQQQDGHWGDIPVHSCPSSCVQFKSNSATFALSTQPPGYRWFELYGDGSYSTAVEFLQNFAQRPDSNCVGY